jgi:ATP-dependent helicase HrpA
VQGEMAYRNLPAGPGAPAGSRPRDLRDDVLDALVAARFLDGRPLPRTRAQFDGAMASAAPGAGALAQEISRAVQQSLEAWSAVQGRLRVLRLPDVQADVEAQLGRLLFAGFPATTPWARLREYPRYLKALVQRLEKAGQDRARDLKLATEAQQWEARYWAQVKAEQGRVPPQDDDFRWLLEEYRVSLYAQQLKTAVPVSAKRLADAWQKRAGAGKT